MKLFLLLFIVGCASASSQEALKRAKNEVVESFLQGMSQVVPLHQALGIQDNEEVRRFERDIKEELTKYLREAFDKALERIKVVAEKGNNLHEEALKELKDLREKMRDLKITDDDVGEKLLDELKNMVKGKLKDLLEKFGILEPLEKRSAEADEPMEADVLGDLNIRNFIIRLKEMILEKMNVEQLKHSLSKIVGQGAQRLCEWLTNRGKEKVIDFFDRVLEKDEEKKKRSVSDLYEQIKEYFKDLDLDFQKKFFVFGEWVREVLEKGLSKSKSKIDNVKAIAKQLLEKSKEISKEVAAQAIEYLKDYKEELGELYEKVHNKLMEKIMDYTD